MVLFVFIIFIFFLEVATFIEVGSEIGVFQILIWIVVSALFGLNRVKYYLFSMASAKGKSDKQSLDVLFHGFIGILGSILLIIPGLVTDFIGTLLLIPVFRDFVKGFILDSFVGSYTFGLMDTDDLKDMKSRYHKKRRRMKDPQSVEESHVVEADFEVVEKEDK